MKLLTQQVGSKKRICSARCYQAEPNTKCSCICAGKLHAVGLSKALDMVSQLGDNLKGTGIEVTRTAMRAIRRKLATMQADGVNVDIETWQDPWSK